jgi:hypothetical protein
MTSPPKLNHEFNTYLTVTLQRASPFINQPSLLSNKHPSLTFTSQVGELEDVKLFSVPKAVWEREGVKDDIFTKLLGETGVQSVEILPEPVKRSKRGEL